MRFDIHVHHRFDEKVTRLLMEIWRGIGKSLNNEEKLMATLQEVKDAVAAEAAEVSAKINELTTEIQRLTDIINGGGAVTAADLDELKAQVEAIFTPVAPPPVEPGPLLTE